MSNEASKYADVVGAQAVELERRMHEAQAEIRISPSLASGLIGWQVTLVFPVRDSVCVRGDNISSTLWLACSKAGLTKGLNPP